MTDVIMSLLTKLDQLLPFLVSYLERPGVLKRTIRQRLHGLRLSLVALRVITSIQTYGQNHRRGKNYCW